jgi:hypothetical protein
MTDMQQPAACPMSKMRVNTAHRRRLTVDTVVVYAAALAPYAFFIDKRLCD